MAGSQRIFAGQAGGKKYFWGDNGKIFDEAGIEQPDKFAQILKANFQSPPSGPPPKQTRTPKTSPAPSVSPTPQPQSPPQQGNSDADNDKPSNDGKGFSGLSSQLAADILKIAFPDLYNMASRYRQVFSGKQKKKPVRKPRQQNGQQQRQRSQADRKRAEAELSLRVETIASNIRTNGELLREQLTLQERTIELLEKISHGVQSGGGHGGGTFSWKNLLPSLGLGAAASWLLPTLGAAATIGTGAFALSQSQSNKEHINDIWNEENTEKYGEEKSKELETVRNESTIGRIIRTYKELQDMVDPRKPKERAAAQANKYDQYGVYQGANGAISSPQSGANTQSKSTKAVTEASQRHPDGKVVTIKGDNITLEARTIKLDARTISINAGSSSTGLTVGGGADAMGGGGGGSGGDYPQTAPYDRPTNDSSDSGDSQQPSVYQRLKDRMLGRSSESSGSEQSVGRGPAQSQFKPDITTPTTNFGTTQEGAPGGGGAPITGGKGATTFGGNVYDKKGSGEAIRKNDLGPAQQFTPSPAGSSKTLAQQRQELLANASPATIQRLKEISLGENQDPKANLAVFESAMNRALQRGQSLDQVLKEYTGKGSDGYYPPSTFAHGVPAYANNAKLRALADENFKRAAAGSNTTDLATDNSSGGLAQRDIGGRNGKPPEFDYRQNYGGKSNTIDDTGKLGVESFVSPRSQKYYDWRQAILDADKKAQQDDGIKNAKTKQVSPILTPDILGNTADMKPWGDIRPAAKQMDQKQQKMEDANEKQSTDDFVKGLKEAPDLDSVIPSAITKATPKGAPEGWRPYKFTDSLVKDKLDEEANKHYFPSLWKLGPSGRNKADQLNNDPWATEPGFRPADQLKPIPDEPPSQDHYNSSALDRSEDDALHDPPEKHEGSHSRLTNQDGQKKPKPIRRIDVKKYYPQYNKSDFGDSTTTVGMTVA